MALGIYLKPDSSTLITSGEHTSPFTVTVDGRNGGALDFKLYVRNDETDKYYSSITVQPIDVANGWLVDNTKGWSWRLIATEQCPVGVEWELVSHGNQISLGSIGNSTFGDIATYLPFWVRVTIPACEQAAQIESVALQVEATEHLI